MCFVPFAKIKSSQVIKFNSFHYLSQPPTNFTITHQFYIENIYNATVSSHANLLALLFAREEISSKCAFGSKFESQLIFTTIHRFYCTFGIIYGSHCTISVNFSLYLQYFHQKVFSFSKISRSQTDPSCDF